MPSSFGGGYAIPRNPLGGGTMGPVRRPTFAPGEPAPGSRPPGYLPGPRLPGQPAPTPRGPIFRPPFPPGPRKPFPPGTLPRRPQGTVTGGLTRRPVRRPRIGVPPEAPAPIPVPAAPVPPQTGGPLYPPEVLPGAGVNREVLPSPMGPVPPTGGGASNIPPTIGGGGPMTVNPEGTIMNPPPGGGLPQEFLQYLFNTYPQVAQLYPQLFSQFAPPTANAPVRTGGGFLAPDATTLG